MPLSKNIYKKINKAKVVSFDIFDTLLLRPYVNPCDLFKHLEEIYNLTGFYDARTRAESLFYNKNGNQKEANFSDIYDFMPKFKDIKEKELKLEFSSLVFNPEMKKLYEYCLKENKIIIIASDMYLSCEFLKKVLEKNGYNNYCKLYVSNEINKRKDTGDMYDFISSDLKIKPCDILHIGDNKYSDYKQAIKHKFKAYHYKKITDEFLIKNKCFKNFYKNNHTSLSASIITSVVSQKESFGNFWVDFGYKIAGPVAYSYACFINQTAYKNNIKNMLFVARDGCLIKKIFDFLNKNNINIKTHYVYAPRIMNYTMNLDFDVCSKKQAEIVCNYYNQNTGGKNCNDYIENKIDLFRNLALKEKEKTGYKDYIKKIIDNDTNIAVIDTISGQLSAQKLIEKESGIKTTGFYYLTLEGQVAIREYEHYDFFVNEYRDKFITGNKPDLIELIFSANENPIITMDNGKPVYSENVADCEKKRQEIYSKIEKGAIAFASEISERFCGSVLHIDKIAIFNLIKSYVENPKKADIEAMYEVKKSPYADNSLYVPLFSAPLPFWKISKTKKLIWRTPLQNLGLFLFNPLTVRIKFFKHFRIIFFPRINKNIFKCCILDKIGIYIGGGIDVR